MSGGIRAFLASWHLELAHLRRNRIFLALTVIEAVTFLVLVSLFGLTGSRDPTAVVDSDNSALSRSFVASLADAHDSFNLQSMSLAEAQQKLSTGNLVAIVEIPKGFGAEISTGSTVAVHIVVDNVDADQTDDIDRAVPSAVAHFGIEHHFPGIRVVPLERDLINHDTGYIPYLIVSALALDALVVAGVITATAIAREWDARTVPAWQTATPSTFGLVLGKTAVGAIVGFAALLGAMVVVVFVYGVSPVHPIVAVLALAGCSLLFAAIGMALGALVRRAIPVAALIFGLAIPLYMDSGALEPERFDGNIIWTLAHLSPMYSAVGVFEWAFHGLVVTPEPVFVDAGVMLLWAAAAIWLSTRLANRRLHA
jgi:ABC-type multidrug transport system permease subunit